jgi:hypothetical protein
MLGSLRAPSKIEVLAAEKPCNSAIQCMDTGAARARRGAADLRSSNVVPALVVDLRDEAAAGRYGRYVKLLHWLPGE